ncbi:arginyl-tRNA--protein transferase 1, partial [Asbolus verrucosus]
MCDKSFVYWYSSLEKHLCGYCKNERGNVSHGMWAKYLTVEDYQNLIDRGWRRSGHYCYKPLMDQICCPMYTIKCDALNFQLSKSQKKVIKKFNKFLKDGSLNVSENHQEQLHNSEGVPEFFYREAPSRVTDINDSFLENDETATTSDNSKQSTSQAESGGCYRSITLPGVSQASAPKPEEPRSQPKSGVGADPNKPPCKKAKILRLERRQEKLLKRGMSLEQIPAKSEQKTLEEFLNDVSQDQKHKFKLELVNTSRRDEEWERLKRVEFALYKKYQMTVHNDPPGKCTVEGFLRFLVNSPLQITLERLDENHRYFKLTADLFVKYQIFVHNETPDECDESQYVSFLVDTPLQHVKFSKDSDLGFGSFHQLYWLDDKLIAVGVIDILPKC